MNALLASYIAISYCLFYLLVLLLGYVNELLTELWKVMEISGSARTVRVTSPPPLCSDFEKPDKKQAIIEHRSRFSQSEKT